MVKARSPGYPAIGLASAIEKVKAVYEQDAQNALPREVVARHAGYNGITGNSLAMLSALLKYGLLTGRGDNTAVSDLALQIIAHPTGTPERRAAILEAAFKPSLFAEIRDHIKGGKVSDAALRSYLLTRKFLPGAVDGVIRAYRETMTLVETEAQGYAQPAFETGTEMPELRPMPKHKEAALGGSFEPPYPPPMQRIQTTEGEPYQFWHSPGHLRGTFDITDSASAEAVLKAVQTWVNAWKLLQQPVGSAQQPNKAKSEDASAEVPSDAFAQGGRVGNQ